MVALIERIIKVNYFLHQIKNNKSMRKIMQTKLLMKKVNRISFILSFFTILMSTTLFAEGTPTLSPNAANITAVLSAPDLASGSYYNAPEDNRIYFNIANAGQERLYFGFDWRQYAVGNPGRLNNVYYRIRRPDGSVAITALWNSATGSIGSIDSHAQALVGPNIGSVTTGYSPLEFNLAMSAAKGVAIAPSDSIAANAGMATKTPLFSAEASDASVSNALDCSSPSKCNANACAATIRTFFDSSSNASFNRSLCNKTAG